MDETTYTWFKIFNRTEFLATGLVSRTYTFVLTGFGQKDILVTLGNALGITYDGVYLPIELNDLNPFVIDERAVYVDQNDDVYLGIQVAS